MKVWITQDAEPLPLLDSGARLMRSAMLAAELADHGHEVIWFAGRFDHSKKTHRNYPSEQYHVRENYEVKLLNGRGYTRNISLNRVLHHRDVARHFREVSSKLGRPDLIFSSYPSPELCRAAYDYSAFHQVKFVIDVRDPWPETFLDYFPYGTRYLVNPLVGYYRRLMTPVFKNADMRIAVSAGMLKFAQNLGLPADHSMDRVFMLGYLRPNVVIAGSDIERKEQINCIFIGSSGSSYDIDLLDQVADILIDDREVSFTLVGDYSFAAKSNLRVTGWLSESEIQRELSIADIGLCFLKGGALTSGVCIPNKVFEYLSQGLAVFYNGRGELSDLLEKNGIGVGNLNEPNVVARTIRDMRASPDKLREMRKRSFDYFDREVSAREIYPQIRHQLEILGTMK